MSKGTASQGLFFFSSAIPHLMAYSDSDWARCPMTMRSVLVGFCLFLGTLLFSWSSKKQNIVSRSSTEAEYTAMADTTYEVTWLKELMASLSVHPHTSLPIPLYCNNMAALSIARNPVYHSKTKHIEMDCHFVREKVQLGVIKPIYVPSKDQLADVFIKPLHMDAFYKIVTKLGMLNLNTPSTCRGDDKINKVMLTAVLERPLD